MEQTNNTYAFNSFISQYEKTPLFSLNNRFNVLAQVVEACEIAKNANWGETQHTEFFIQSTFDKYRELVIKSTVLFHELTEFELETVVDKFSLILLESIKKRLKFFFRHSDFTTRLNLNQIFYLNGDQEVCKYLSNKSMPVQGFVGFIIDENDFLKDGLYCSHLRITGEKFFLSECEFIVLSNYLGLSQMMEEAHTFEHSPTESTLWGFDRKTQKPVIDLLIEFLCHQFEKVESLSKDDLNTNLIDVQKLYSILD